jgi:acetylornithine deacetylase/succinyl-diaminopimelate desuccinylase-like protein
VEKIGNYAAPVHLTTIVRRYFEGIAPLQDDEISKWIRSIDTPDRGEHAARVLADANPMWNAMMRDTISPTMLTAGVRANVIPSEATATLNIRLLPGNTITTLLAALNKIVNDPQVKLEVQPDGGLAAPDSSLESDFYAAIVKASAEEFGGAPVLPYQSTWATDSSQLRLHNVQSFGLVPFPLTEEDIKRMHAEDERIPAAAFAKGVKLMARLVGEFAASH